jgi:hypothetical protein
MSYLNCVAPESYCLKSNAISMSNKAVAALPKYLQSAVDQR